MNVTRVELPDSLVAFIQRSLSPSSMKTLIRACAIPRVDAWSFSVDPGSLVTQNHQYAGVFRPNKLKPDEHGLACISENEVMAG